MRWLVLVLALGACDNHGATPDWSRMITQPKALPFGGEMRPLPDGVVPRDWIADPELRTGRTADGKDVQDIPLPITRALLDRGRDRFAVTCAACHGIAGDGNSAVARNMERRRPPSLHEQRVLKYSAGALYRVIASGYGLMPSYAALLSVEDRWAVVAYVRTLGMAWTAKLDALPPAERAAVEARLP